MAFDLQGDLAMPGSNLHGRRVLAAAVKLQEQVGSVALISPSGGLTGSTGSWMFRIPGGRRSFDFPLAAFHRAWTGVLGASNLAAAQGPAPGCSAFRRGRRERCEIHYDGFGTFIAHDWLVPANGQHSERSVNADHDHRARAQAAKIIAS